VRLFLQQNPGLPRGFKLKNQAATAFMAARNGRSKIKALLAAAPVLPSPPLKAADSALLGRRRPFRSRQLANSGLEAAILSLEPLDLSGLARRLLSQRCHLLIQIGNLLGLAIVADEVSSDKQANHYSHASKH